MFNLIASVPQSSDNIASIRFPVFMELDTITGYETYRVMWQSNDLHWKLAEKCQPYLYTSLAGRMRGGRRVIVIKAVI